jgi:putative addiction module killer protein
MTEKIDKPSTVLYEGQNIEIRESIEFRDWLDNLRDRKARLRIDDRIKRLAAGHLGDTKSVGDGIQELRFKFGPGYRVYYTWVGKVLVLLLTGGDKDSQVRDIVRAKRLAKEAEDGVEDTPL